MAAFAGKSQQIFMPAVSTFDTGETVAQITAAWLSSAKLKVAVDYLFGIGAKKVGISLCCRLDDLGRLTFHHFQALYGLRKSQHHESVIRYNTLMRTR